MREAARDFGHGTFFEIEWPQLNYRVPLGLMMTEEGSFYIGKLHDVERSSFCLLKPHTNTGSTEIAEVFATQG
jgi:hypothetical protein